MNPSTPLRALIAEDEPILAATLAATLRRVWPDLAIAGTAPNGVAAVQQALELQPDILFLDIKMPGQSGLEAAQELAERWEGPRPFPQVVFVTAYDDYAVQAFEQAAVDYVMKPVSDARLARTVERLKARIVPTSEKTADDGLAQLVEQMRALLPEAGGPAERLTVVRAAVGSIIRMIPVQDVAYFQALDKYVNVASAGGDALIRLSLKDLLPQLDPDQFRQISRGAIVNMRHVTSASRDDAGKLTLHLRDRADTLRVSPLLAHLFRQM
ncbi:LytTR family DNA-binding domain-containing protein [Massilia luteola]|uniref:LytR/AlgR family response regulator transcription factor n=1 Tax=Massilia luteola TaxID=3081751 RepID=UPI002ACC3890|nr:LytTR family DNA-binding domain-containing protein [Massilia sp. Gc5]